MYLCPNYEALNKALLIYRSGMRDFIIFSLKKTWGLDVEDVIIESLDDVGQSKRANEIRDRLAVPDANIKSIIDINDFPYIIEQNWAEIFGRPLHYDNTFRNQLWLIKEARNNEAHRGEADAEPEWTRAHLFHIADVLGKINNLDAKHEVERIRNNLFADNTLQQLTEKEQQLAETQAQLGARLTNAEKRAMVKEVLSTPALARYTDQAIASLLLNNAVSRGSVYTTRKQMIKDGTCVIEIPYVNANGTHIGGRTDIIAENVKAFNAALKAATESISTEGDDLNAVAKLLEVYETTKPFLTAEHVESFEKDFAKYLNSTATETEIAEREAAENRTLHRIAKQPTPTTATSEDTISDDTSSLSMALRQAITTKRDNN